jgi:hypothetical protein
MKTNTEHPFLSNLGIPPLDQARVPTEDTFPLAFNPNNRSLWGAAIQNLTLGPDPMTDWGFALKEYVRLCAQRGVYPFQNFHESRNDDISDYLRERRRAFVKFVNRVNLFETIKIRSTHRRVTVTEKGFVLTVYAKTLNTDPSFIKWLREIPMPRFDLIRHNGRYKKHIPGTSGLEIFVENDGADNMHDRWIIGYDIICPMFPDLPTNHTPSKAELERFILDILWMPLLRSMRPLNRRAVLKLI